MRRLRPLWARTDGSAQPPRSKLVRRFGQRPHPTPACINDHMRSMVQPQYKRAYCCWPPAFDSKGYSEQKARAPRSTVWRSCRPIEAWTLPLSTATSSTPHPPLRICRHIPPVQPSSDSEQQCPARLWRKTRTHHATRRNSNIDVAFVIRPWLSPLIFPNENSDARDHCANERTFLSWLRLAIYLAVVSVAIVISFHLKQQPSATELKLAIPLGVVFWVLSLACLASGMANYVRTVTRYSRRAALVQSGWKTQLVRPPLMSPLRRLGRAATKSCSLRSSRSSAPPSLRPVSSFCLSRPRTGRVLRECTVTDAREFLRSPGPTRGPGGPTLDARRVGTVYAMRRFS